MTVTSIQEQPGTAVRSVLVIGSASAANTERAVAAVRARFPGARITLALPGEPDAALQRAAGDAQIVPGVTAGAVHRLSRHDVKVALFTGEGHNMLKLASFMAPAPRLLIYTEGGGMFAWSVDDRLAVWNHLRWRLSGGGPLPAQAARLARAIANPIIALAAFSVLLLWHARMWLVRRRGGGARSC